MKNKFGVEKESIKKGCLINTTTSIGFGKNLGRTRGGFKIEFSNGKEVATFEQIREVRQSKTDSDKLQ